LSHYAIYVPCKFVLYTFCLGSALVRSFNSSFDCLFDCLFAPLPARVSRVKCAQS